MKRIFSLVLVFAMVLGSFGTVFAAADVATEDLKKVPTDVVGTEYEKAVSRLVAFDVLNGYKDGTYKPEQDVTRAEFAKILVEALGIGNAAQAAVGKVTFPDVTASHWASGYINVASGQGLIEGFPNGNFQPNDQVTYAEALTMLVRALGYQDSFLKGAWPGSHIAKAAEAGITSGVSYSDARGFANRGKVAQMVNNTLDADVVKVETYKDGTVEYTESNVSLLKDKLDVSKYEDARVIADKLVNDGLNEDEITVKFLKEIKKDDEAVKNSYDEGEERDFTVEKNVNARKNIGEEVSVYMNDKNEVVYIETENDDKAHFDYVEEAKGNDDEVTEVSLVKFDKDYEFAKDAKVYVYNAKDDQYKDITVDKDGARVDVKDVLGNVGKFVVKNNRVVYAEVMESSEALPWMLVLENDKGLLKGINETTEDFDLDLSDDGNYDGVFAFDTMGNALDVEDIEAGNIVYVSKLDYDGDDYVQVVAVQDNMVEGELSRVKDDRVTIGEKQIKAVRYSDGGKQYQAFYSVEGFEDIKKWDHSDYDNDMEDADEENMVAYLDVAGRIAFLSTEATGTSGFKYGVVTRTYYDNDRIKIYTHVEENDGEEITYRVEEEKNLGSPIKLDKYGNASKKADGKLEYLSFGKAGDAEDLQGYVVKFKLNKDGEIAEDEFYVMEQDNTWVMKDKEDFGKSSLYSTFQIKTNDEHKSFAINNRAVIVDAKGLTPGVATGFDTDDFGIAKWEDMAEDNYNEDLEYYVFTKRDNDIDVDALIFVGEAGANTASDEEAIYVIDKWSKGGDDYIKYISYEDNKIETKEVDSVQGKLGKERPYIAKMKSDGKIDLYNTKKDTLNFVEGVVETKSNNVITLKGDNEEYKLSSSAIVYEEDTKKSTSNIRKGDSVLFIVENNVNIRVIERLIGSEILDGSSTGGKVVATDGTVTYITDKTIQLDNGKEQDVVGAAKVVLGRIKTAFFDGNGLPKDGTKVELQLTKTDDNVTGIKNVVVTTSEKTEFDSALTENSVVKVNVTSNLTGITGTVDHLVDIDFGGKTITGNLNVNTTEKGTMTLSGKSGSKLIGNLDVTATNATFNQNVEVTGTVTVNAISNSTYNLNAKADKVVWNAAKAKLNLNAAVDKVEVKSGKEVVIKGTDKIATELKVDGKADLDKAVADAKLAAGTKANISIAGTATDEAALATAKAAKKAEVDALVKDLKEADYTTASWTDLTDAITADKNAIDAKTKVVDVNDYVLTTIAAKADLVDLAGAKTAKKAAVDAVIADKDEADYTTTSWAAVKDAMILDKAKIDAKETVAEVEAYELTAKVGTLVEKTVLNAEITAIATDAATLKLTFDNEVKVAADKTLTFKIGANSYTAKITPITDEAGATTVVLTDVKKDNAGEALDNTALKALNGTVTVEAGALDVFEIVINADTQKAGTVTLQADLEKSDESL
jgi:S-layer family protein